jgi:hypothetical protein
VGKINIERKRSLYIGKDCYEKSQNYCSIDDSTTELNIHLKDPVSTKTVRRELRKLNIQNSAAIDKPLLAESNDQISIG